MTEVAIKSNAVNKPDESPVPFSQSHQDEDKRMANPPGDPGDFKSKEENLVPLPSEPWHNLEAEEYFSYEI
jgi:hypothetical protein